jgi:hypothetical protein
MLLRALVVVCPRRRPDELELDSVWVLEEEGVIARPVLGELSGPVRNACPELSDTFGGGVEGRVVGDLEAEMVEADTVAIHGLDVGHDEIDMVNTRGTHRATVVRKAPAL